MREESVARRYMEALFQTAAQNGVEEEVAEDFDDFIKMMSESEMLQAFVRSHRIPGPEKSETFREMFGDAMNGYLLNTLSLMLKNQRGDLPGTVNTLYHRRLKRYRNITPVETITATKMPESLREEVVSALSKALNANVELHEQVDESLIGGIQVRIGNTVYDGSVVHQLEKLRERLT